MDRLHHCCRYFQVANGHQASGGLTGLLRQSVGGILEWMVHHSREHETEGNYDEQDQEDEQEDEQEEEGDHFDHYES